MSLTNASPDLAARAAKISSRTLATLSQDARNQALDAVHDALAAARDQILAANAVDLEKAKQSTADGELNPSIYKRLDLSRPGKFDDMLQGIRDVRRLADPGRSIMWKLRTLFPTFLRLLAPWLHPADFISR
jgi:glutamate-5-semialdehyde dehydrogenase